LVARRPLMRYFFGHTVWARAHPEAKRPGGS
jgi:hypothetical protein